MKSDRTKLAVSVTFLQCFGVATIVMVSVWCSHYRGGFAWDRSAKEFNYHPVFMIVSMIFLNSQAMISYRVFSRDSKPLVKWLHMMIQVIAFVFGVLGLQAVFDFHNGAGIANMYSLHSWIGMGSFVLFSCQVTFGILGFMYPMFPDDLRALYLKVHVYFGTAIFLMAVGAVLTGLTEKVLFSISKTYKDFPPEGILINLIGAFVVIHAGLTFYIVKNDSFKQTAASEEHQELLDRSTEGEAIE